MANDALIKAEAERGRKMLEDQSRSLEAQHLQWRDARQRDRLFFPSLHPSSRGPVSPLDGRSKDWEWSGKKGG